MERAFALPKAFHWGDLTQGGCRLYKIKFKDFEKKIKDMKKWFIHPWKPLQEAIIRELALFDTILFGLKQSTFLIKSCFILGLGPVLDHDPQTPPQKKSGKKKIFWAYISDDFKTKKNYKEKFCFKKGWKFFLS